MRDNDGTSHEEKTEFDLVKESEKKMGKGDDDAEESATVTVTQERAVTEETKDAEKPE